jgi:hypothetical protein
MQVNRPSADLKREAVARLACEVGQNKGYKTTVYLDLSMEEEVFQSVCLIFYLVLSRSRKGTSMRLSRSDNTMN